MEKIFKIEYNLTHLDDSKITYYGKRSPYLFLYEGRHVGYEYNKKGYYIKRENGTTYLLAYTKSGSATVTYDKETVTLTAGSLLFINLALQSEISAENSHWEIYFIHLYGPEIDLIYKSFYRDYGFCMRDFKSEKFVETINALYKIYKKEDVDIFNASQLIYGMLMDILSQRKPVKYDHTVTEIIDYIEAHYAEPFNIDDLCRKLFMSKSYLIHKFHDGTGMSPKKYLTDVRIRKAKMYLAQTERSVADIAALTGFENEKNIYYAFKSVTGYSPTEFRNNIH